MALCFSAWRTLSVTKPAAVWREFSGAELLYSGLSSDQTYLATRQTHARTCVHTHTHTCVHTHTHKCSELATHEVTHFTCNSISTVELTHRSHISRYAHTFSTHACFSITVKTFFEDFHCILFEALSVNEMSWMSLKKTHTHTQKMCYILGTNLCPLNITNLQISYDGMTFDHWIIHHI